MSRTLSGLSPSIDVKPVVAFLRARGGADARPGAPVQTRPFVTVSREAGAGGSTFARSLVARLNDMASSRLALEEPAAMTVSLWQAFDRELVERIAADAQVSAGLIERLETGSHTWLDDFMSGASLQDREPSEAALLRRVVGSVRALAEAGRVVLVGLGGVAITHAMPGGLHVRIVAPLQHRITHMAALHGETLKQAAERVRLLDENRATFFRKFFPETPLSPEQFHLTLNSGLLSETEMVDTVLPLLRGK